MALRILGESGHYRPGADTNHFMGLCAECDSHYMARMTLDQVQRWYETDRALRPGQVRGIPAPVGDQRLPLQQRGRGLARRPHRPGRGRVLRPAQAGDDRRDEVAR